MIEHIQASLLEAQVALEDLLRNRPALDQIEQASSMMIETLQRKGRIYSCGNGGSMCDAMHFAEELTGRYRKNRVGLAAIAISDPSHLSCAANDYGYEEVFSRYISAHGRPGDCLLAISTSGASPNILKAAHEARQLGITIVGLTGRSNSELEKLADVCICTPGGQFADRVQELHIKVIHILIELIERRLCPENYAAGT
jgi:D-sedoheptulose 7-phosphate isomerase